MMISKQPLDVAYGIEKYDNLFEQNFFSQKIILPFYSTSNSKTF